METSSSESSTTCSTTTTSSMSTSSQEGSPLKPILCTPAKVVISSTPPMHTVDVLRKRLRDAGLPDHGNSAQIQTRVDSLDRIVCFDDDIIETSAKSTLEEYLDSMGMLKHRPGTSGAKKTTKKQLQKTLRTYLDTRAQNCELPATLLRRGDFWRVCVRRKNTPRSPTKVGKKKPTYIVRAAWGKLGRKRLGQRATPKKILPTPTKTKAWQKEFKTMEEAMRYARNRIQSKRSEGYYLSSDGTIAVESKDNNTPVMVRQDSQRALKFAGILRVREFNKTKPSNRFSDVAVSTPTNFDSDNES